MEKRECALKVIQAHLDLMEISAIDGYRESRTREQKRSINFVAQYEKDGLILMFNAGRGINI